MAIGHNQPTKIVRLTEEEIEFLYKNADSNICFALNTLQSVQRSTGEKLVEMIEKFRIIKSKLDAAE